MFKHINTTTSSLYLCTCFVSEEVLRLPVVSTSLVFKCDQPLADFRMIERHYFRGKLIKSYDFTFAFCIPGSINTWDVVYDVPPLDEETIRDMIAHPYETTSDSFYFVDNILVMHNKAKYRYLKGKCEPDASADKLGSTLESLSLLESGDADASALV